MTRQFQAAAWNDDDTARLIACFDTARRAPSAGFSQGTHLVLLEGARREEWWQVSGAGEWFAERAPGVLDAPLIAIVAASAHDYLARYAAADKHGHGLDHRDGWPVPHWLTDAAMVVQNLLLLIDAEPGWGALYFGLFRNVAATQAWLGLPDEVDVLGALAVGRRAEADRPSGSATRRARRPLDEVVHRQRWRPEPSAGPR